MIVSVIMPAYNADKYIKQAIKSILNQTYANWELLICDDCSLDNTLKIIKDYDDPRIKVFENKANQGYLKTCNFLFQQSSGTFITFQDADDWSETNRLACLISEFTRDAQLQMVGSFARIVDYRGVLIQNDKRPKEYSEILNHLKVSSAFNGATVMIKKKVLNIVGGYRLFFNDYAYQDYDWTWRIAEKFKSINIPQYLYNYRQTPDSNSKKIDIKRAISKELVIWLGNQRFCNGKDSIDRGDLQYVQEFIDEKTIPYLNDNSLIYREYSSSFMYQRLYREAISASLNAIKANPRLLVNYRTFFYCFRKSIF